MWESRSVTRKRWACPRQNGRVVAVARRPGPRSLGGGLRAGYFALASVWGCLAGTGALVVGLSVLGRPIRLGSTLAAFLAVAVIIAVIGGLLSAAAYRAASRRYR